MVWRGAHQSTSRSRLLGHEESRLRGAMQKEKKEKKEEASRPQLPSSRRAACSSAASPRNGEGHTH